MCGMTSDYELVSNLNFLKSSKRPVAGPGCVHDRLNWNLWEWAVGNSRAKLRPLSSPSLVLNYSPSGWHVQKQRKLWLWSVVLH